VTKTWWLSSLHRPWAP